MTLRRLPHDLEAGVTRVLQDVAGTGSIADAAPVGGGCIHRGTRITWSDGRAYFLKWNPSPSAGAMFRCEVAGLEALAAAGPLRVPRPVAVGDEGDQGPAWLLMEYIEPGPAGRDHDEALGAGLAALHHPRPGARWGWGEDNWIGSLPQGNASTDDWPTFWRDRRLAPQVERARRSGLLRGEADRVMDALLGAVPGALADTPDAPGLLHGDLWSGNAFADAHGRPVLIDPAVYHGHGEVDLAMMELFGGFGGRVFAAYDDVLGIPEAYAAVRRDVYQLYYLLVHVNLFGAGYLGGTLAAARRVLAEVG